MEMFHSSCLTIVMYHYVRPLVESDFPRLKALELVDFLAQLDYLSTAYNIISPALLRDSLNEGARLPKRACLLTFDDGYRDHYENVYPALLKRGLAGLFFPPYSSLIERNLLEVNKVQFILASTDRPEALAVELDDFLNHTGAGNVQELRSKSMIPNRYDSHEVAYFKILLQHALPVDVRSAAIDQLFERHITTDVLDFASMLYLSVSEAQEMRKAGNEFGGHGWDHLWHAKASTEELDREIRGSIQVLDAIGAPVSGGYYCYPFGSHHERVCAAVAKVGFSVGFTVEPKLFEFDNGDKLRASRLDTNDLPKSPPLGIDQWLLAAENCEKN